MKATVVTALFDIGRKDLDGRGMDQYHKWFADTLKISCPMVIYCEDSLNSFIEKHRPAERDTKIINQKLEEVPYYYLKDKMDHLLKDDDYQARIKDPNRIECKTSLYSIIQYSKFPWVERAAIENHFNSDYFIWMDAGISRLIPDLDLSQNCPGENFSSIVTQHPGKVFYQMYVNSYPDLIQNSMNEDYFWDNRSFVCGGVFGVDRFSAISFRALIEDVLLRKMLESGRLNNEQLAIGYLMKKVTDSFLILQNNSYIHRNFEILYQLFS